MVVARGLALAGVLFVVAGAAAAVGSIALGAPPPPPTELEACAALGAVVSLARPGDFGALCAMADANCRGPSIRPGATPYRRIRRPSW
jgi:hypothetical protein